MQKFWILGAGKFGVKAARALRRRHPDAEIIVVDSDADACRGLEKASFTTVCTHGPAYLSGNLTGPDLPDWIVPAIPVHVAYEWIRFHLEKTRHCTPMAVPEGLADVLPNAMHGADGALYVSNADFICPDNCREPDDICTYTGNPRPAILHAVLAALQYAPFVSIAVRSRQLAPGVGGYTPENLFAALAKASETAAPLLISTACKCHGVVHALETTPK